MKRSSNKSVQHTWNEIITSGYTKPISTISFNERGNLIQCIKKHYCILKVKAELEVWTRFSWSQESHGTVPSLTEITIYRGRGEQINCRYVKL